MKIKHLLKRTCLSLALLIGAGTAWAESWEAVELRDLTSSDIFVIVDVTSSTAMSNDKGTSNPPSAVTVTLSSDKTQIISTITDNIKWKIEKDGDYFIFHPNGSSSTWLYCTNTNNGVRIGTNADNKKFSVFTSENYTGLKNEATSRYIGVYSNQDWRCYTTVTGNSNIKTTSIKYYKYNANGVSLDEDAPEFIANYPIISNIKTTSVDLLVKTNEACKVYFMTVAAGTAAPDADAIIANESVSCSANTETSATISNLTKATAYDIYVIAKDFGENQTVIQKIGSSPNDPSFTTESREFSSVLTAPKFYTDENATITWTTDGINANANVKIELYKGSSLSATLATSTINDGNETVKIPGTLAYGADYKIRVSLADASAVYGKTENITIIPNITINELLTNTDNNGKSKYENSVVRVKGLVTGIKTYSATSCNFTLQDGNGVFNSIFVSYCENGTTALGDSVYVEGLVNYPSNSILLQIGKSGNGNQSQATIINQDNDIPAPSIISLTDVKNNAYLNKIVKLEGLTITSKQGDAYIGKQSVSSNDSISIYGNLTSSKTVLSTNKKYDITALVGYRSGAKTKYELWPRTNDTAAVTFTGKNRTYVIDDIYMYSSDTTLSIVTINGEKVQKDTMFVKDFDNCKGIAATTTHAKAVINSIKVNGNEVADLATITIAENDLISITVTAEDGTVGTRNIRILKDTRSFNFATLQTNTFNTNNTINLSWTQENITTIDLYFTTENNEFKLNSDVIAASELAFNYTVQNGVFGTGYIKAISTTDYSAIDSVAITINDTQAPGITQQTPGNNATGIATNIYLTISFDEAVIVAENAKLKVNEAEAKIVVINDTAIKAFFENLDYATEYTVAQPTGSVTDAAGNTPALNWKFTTRPQPEPELFFSEYCKGKSSNKYYEIFNPKDEDVDLSNYIIRTGMNGNTWNNTMVPSGILASEDVYVVANEGAESAILIASDTTHATITTNFSGDDAIGLFKITNGDTVLIDVFGKYRESVKWTVAGIINATDNHTLIRKDGIVCGSTDWTEQAGTDSLDSQWIVKEKDDFSDIGKHGVGHRAKARSFNIVQAEVPATIDEENHTITIEAVYGTNLTAIKPQLSLSRGATATINGVPVTENATFDFSQPVQLVITSEDGLTSTEWTITITVAALPSTAAYIRTFSFANAKPLSINIDTAAATVSALFDYGTDITALTPVFTISAAASVSETTLTIDSLQQYTSVEPIDFSTPWTIKVQAQDKNVSKVWTISASTLQPEALTIYQIQYTDKDASAYVGKFVSTIGVITSINGKEIYIQDSASAWNGVLVYDAKEVAKDAKAGDKVKVIGNVTEYSTITEIELAAIEVLSSGNSVEPIVMTIEDAETEAYEAVLVTFKNVTCKRIEQKNDYNNYIIEDATDTLTVYNKYKLDIQMIVDSVYDVTGIMHYYPAGKVYEIIPRTPADIVKVEKENNGGNGNGGNNNPNAISDAVANISIYAYNRTIVVENANADIAIFDVNGRMVAKRTANNSRIEMQLPKSGLYIVKVGDTSQKVVLK